MLQPRNPTPPFDHDAVRIEALVLRHLPTMLKSGGFALNDSEPCKMLQNVLQPPIRRFSQILAEEIDTGLAAWDNRKSKNDLISEIVNDQIAVHSAAITKYAYAININYVDQKIESDSIPCSKGVENATILGNIYESAINEHLARRTQMPKSKNFIIKRNNKKWSPPWGIDYIIGLF